MIYKFEAHAVVVEFVLAVDELVELLLVDINPMVTYLLVGPPVDLVLSVEAGKDNQWVHYEHLHQQEEQVPRKE